MDDPSVDGSGSGPGDGPAEAPVDVLRQVPERFRSLPDPVRLEETVTSQDTRYWAPVDASGTPWLLGDGPAGGADSD